MKTKEEILNEHLSPEFLCDNSREISCDRCVYRNEHRMCWAIKGPCDISHLKCDYRLDTKLSETPKPR